MKSCQIKIKSALSQFSQHEFAFFDTKRHDTI